jgi:hypothetical protein
MEKEALMVEAHDETPPQYQDEDHVVIVLNADKE